MKTHDIKGQFMALLAELREGGTLAELDAGLAELGQAIESTNRPGELLLKLRFDPAGKNDGTLLLVADSIQVKAPRLPKRSTVVFNRDGLVTREDQRQLTLDEVELPQPVDTQRSHIQPVPPIKSAD